MQYQDEIHGSLLIQADRVIELIYLKYMKAYISYDNVMRIETYPFPKDAIREAIYNALIHSNYAALIPIQIRIHEDVLYISNDCIFPINWTVETLMQRHRSQPYNPNIANGFFRAGYVETWGRGIEKICEACKEYGIPAPEYRLHLEDIMVKFTALKKAKYPNRQNVVKDVVKEEGLEKDIIVLISNNSEVTTTEMAEKLQVTSRTIQRKIKELKERGIIERKGGKRYGHWEVNK